MQIISIKLYFLNNSYQGKNKGRRNQIVIYKMCFVSLSQLTKCVLVSTSQRMIKGLKYQSH